MSKVFDHQFECSRIHNDSSEGDESINIYTPNSTSFISESDVVAMAKYYGYELVKSKP